jgi:hypothetical protein
MEEKYPPGTWVERLDPSTNNLLAGTVMDIPFSGVVLESSNAPLYTILFNNGTTSSVPLSEMASLIPSPPVHDEVNLGSQVLLPPFLQLNSKITYEHDGQFHKGFLGIRNGVYCFMFKSHVNKCKEDWGINLPNLSQNWVDLCVEGVLAPGHVAHSFLRAPSSPYTFDPVASFISAVNLHWDCSLSLLKALATAHPHHEVWLQSYYKAKCGIESLTKFCKITLGEYCALWEKGAPKAIPTMCVLTIKKNENLLPLRAKSHIIVLGIHEDGVWSKLDHFVPVLRGDSLCFLVSLASRKGTLFIKVIARMPSVKVFCLLGKLLSSAPRLGILILTPMNTGSFNKHSMVFVVACIIGTTKSTKSSTDWSLPFSGGPMPFHRLYH